MAIAPATRMGPVELTVSDLPRALDYWQNEVGLGVLAREDGTAQLGADSTLVTLVEEPGARPADGHTGLYHVALLVPDRPSLARWLAHAARDRVPLVGLSDHAVSEAIYLRDPDGSHRQSSSTPARPHRQIRADEIAPEGPRWPRQPSSSASRARRSSGSVTIASPPTAVRGHSSRGRSQYSSTPLPSGSLK